VRVQPAQSRQPGPSEPAGELCYLARQPILDLRGRVHGYELLFRAGPETSFRGDGNAATRSMLDNMVLFGLQRLTGGASAFMNCTQETLTENLVHLLPSGLAVLEILESVDPTPDLLAACHRLKALGFRLALDDFVWKPEFAPLVELADYIKVDFVKSGPEERQSLLHRLRNVAVAYVAEKIETQEDYKQARLEGFKLFQGYYFCRPVLLKNRKIPANRFSQIEIMRLLRSDPIDLHKLTQQVKRDASLTYRLLRLVNSPMCAMRQEVSSIQAALLAVGEDTFRRIAMLAIASEFNEGQPAEILRMAFVRGRFCELAASKGEQDPTEQYLLGMLSLLPAMMRLPMEELTQSLPLRKEICDALNRDVNSEGKFLRWLEYHELADWDACDAVAEANGLDQEHLLRCYADAMVWAEEALQAEETVA